MSDTKTALPKEINVKWTSCDLTEEEIRERNASFQAGYKTGWKAASAWRQGTDVCAWCGLILVAPMTAKEHVKACNRSPYPSTIGRLDYIESLLVNHGIGKEGDDVIGRLRLLLFDHADMKAKLTATSGPQATPPAKKSKGKKASS